MNQLAGSIGGRRRRKRSSERDRLDRGPHDAPRQPISGPLLVNEMDEPVAAEDRGAVAILTGASGPGRLNRGPEDNVGPGRLVGHGQK